MNPSLALAVMLIGAGLLLVLPLVPAIVELRRRSDAMPLIVVQDHAGEIRYFADSFRSFVETIEPVLQSCLLSRKSETGSMRDGTHYLALAGTTLPTLSLGRQNANTKKATCGVLVAAVGNLQLPPSVVFDRDIFAKGDIVGGAESEYRAILGDRNIHLGLGSTLQRWVHANGTFTADAECKLYGRVSSDSRIQLATKCTFLRLNAPRVQLGKSRRESSDIKARVPEVRTHRGHTPNPDVQESLPPTRLLHEGDLEVRAGQTFNGNLIVRGKLHVGNGAKIQGSVKCEKDALIANDASVAGSLIAQGKLRIGRHCSIHGPVISEREIFIQRDTQCGTEQVPTTVSAPRIIAEEGVEVFGTVWARELGSVVTG